MLSAARARRPRDERGAFAVLFAISALMLFSVAALSVDLGNVYQRKREVQSQADLAATAAASKLPDQAAVLTAVCNSAVLNGKIGQTTTNCSASGAVGSSTTSLANPACPAPSATNTKAYVYFFAANPYKIKVCSPGAKVSFGLAAVIPGVGDSARVQADATMVAGTMGASAEMPFYGVGGSGCDWGPQALTDPAKGQAASGTGLPSNLATPTTGSVNQNTAIAAISPTQVPTLTATVLKITGTSLAKVTEVGFYRETTETPSKVEPGPLVSSSDSTGKTVTVTLPATSPLLAQEGLWYVRVYETGNNASQTGWSKTALVLRVGDPVISCGAVSSSGNFGSLVLPRTDSNKSTSGGWTANDIATGPQPPLSLSVHDQAASPWTCVAGGTGVRYSTTTGTPTLTPRTNCLTTDPGLTSVATTAGFITGTTLANGRLANKPTSTGVLGGRSCGPGHTSASRTVAGVSINNDTLSCFLVNPDTTVGTISSSTYSGGTALDPAIFRSPRFCLVPIFQADPSRGRSLNYSITDFRPCFITNETTASSWNSQQFAGGTGTNNGLTMNAAGTKIETLGVVFFNRNALPNSGGSVGDYTGIGPLAVQMVD